MLACYSLRVLRGNVLESNDMVTRLDVGHALTHRLDNARTLMAENHGEGALGILARECVGIYPWDLSVHSFTRYGQVHAPV